MTTAEWAIEAIKLRSVNANDDMILKLYTGLAELLRREAIEDCIKAGLERSAAWSEEYQDAVVTIISEFRALADTPGDK